jgi:hypothetical protein
MTLRLLVTRGRGRRQDGEAVALGLPGPKPTRLVLLLLRTLWRAPEAVLPALHQKREIRRCQRELDRAIRLAKERQVPASEIDAAFDATPVTVPSHRPPALVLSFPVRGRGR